MRDLHVHAELCAHHPEGVREVRRLALVNARNG